MIVVGGPDAEDIALRRRLQEAQAESTLQNIRLTLLANIFIAVSISYLTWLENPGTSVGYWLAMVIGLGVVRYLIAHHIAIRGVFRHNPAGVLKLFTVMALISGLSWCLVPLYYDDASKAEISGHVIFIMAGLTTGAIIQSLASWRIAIAFGGPLMVATLFKLAISGTSLNNLIATNVVLLTIMLFRAAILGERNFLRNQETAFRATRLADSLAVANDEVSDANQKLESLAKTDALTGLGNRVLFKQAGEFACSSNAPVSLALFDLDKFKLINDTRGHKAGDTVLQEVATRLASVCGPSDLAVRLGGDEFAVLVTGENAEARARQMADAFISQMNRVVRIDCHSVTIAASIGIATSSGDTRDCEDLYARADMALYRAKDAGRGCIRVFDAEMKDELDRRRVIDRDLERALLDNVLGVQFQPQAVLATGEVIGFEALARWTHPQAGAIDPTEVVLAAAKLNISEQLTRRVAEAACVFLQQLDEAGFSDQQIAINISPREFDLYSPGPMLKETVQRFGIKPSQIEIEITEESLFDPQKMGSELALIEKAGFKLAIDDFGAGHASISNLMAVKIDRLKIDKSFVQGIARNQSHQELIGAIVAVARPLGHDLVMEGVETEEDAETLRMLGCRFGQGWLYGRAMTAEDAVTYMCTQRNSDRKSA
jgi:diguanylate cyclase (GGDEF)-like protein